MTRQKMRCRTSQRLSLSEDSQVQIMRFLKVPRKMGESVRRELIEKGIFASDYPIIAEGEFILFPITAPFGGFETVEREIRKRPKRYYKLTDALSEFLSPSEMGLVISSFDIVGDIAIVEIPETLAKYETRIGEALLKIHKNVKAVFKKLGPMEGEFRVRQVRCIAGEDRTTTLYRESGVVMELDVAKVYFSVRLSHERLRVAEQVKSGERILALFAGVGPFPLVISKKHPDTEIVAIELNPDAVNFMKRNIELNKAANVKVIWGDVRDVVLEKYRDFADRVLMPLPKGAYDFLDVAFAGVKDGGIIHFYTFSDIRKPFVESIAKAECAAEKNGVSIDVVGRRIVRPYSPTTVQVVLDLRVRKGREN